MGKRLHTIRSVISSIRLATRYLKDPQVSNWKKFLLIFPLLYIISPVDLISDYPLLGVGWLDDTAITLAVWRYLSFSLQQYKNETSDQKEDGGDQQTDYTLEDDEYDIK